jgi:hypothetical protein
MADDDHPLGVEHDTDGMAAGNKLQRRQDVHLDRPHRMNRVA